MAAPVMSHDSIPLPEEVEHLGVPVVRAQWPAMMEDEGLRVLGAPVLVNDRHPILRGDRAHWNRVAVTPKRRRRGSRSISRSHGRAAIEPARRRSASPTPMLMFSGSARR